MLVAAMNTAPRLEADPVFDAGWCMQLLPSADLVVLYGRMTSASFERFFEASLRSIDEYDGERIGIVHDVRDPQMIEAHRRNRFGKALKAREEQLARTRAHVMIAGSPLLRSSLKVMQWIAPPKHPHAVTSSVPEACSFIARHVPSADPADLERKLEQLRLSIHNRTQGASRD
jgi:hypothetical protein